MMEGDRGGRHPSPTELDGFLLGELSPSQAASVVVHLVRGCEVCRERMAPLASMIFANGPIAPPKPAVSNAEYDFPLFRAFATARLYAETRAGGRALAGQRSGHGFPKEVPLLTAGSAEAADDVKRRCEALLERSRALRFTDPEGMILAASLAVTLAERMGASEGKPAARADLLARAWAELGNAHRVADDLISAEAALARALALSGHGTGDPLLLARLADVTASLFNEQQRFEDAHRLLDAVHAIHRHMGDRHMAGRALVSKGLTAYLALDSEKVIQLLNQGLALVDPARDPKLILSAVHGLLFSLVDGGRMAEARTLLEASCDLYRIHGERLDLLRARWLEGRIAAGLGEDAAAEQAFLQSCAGFQEADLPSGVAMVSLDLAALWLRQGRTAEIKDAVDEMVAIFRARNIHREAIGALLMLKKALQKDRATAALLQAVAAELRQWEGMPARKSHVPG
jgi:tetratricopeptide (TPR) repeat protein